MELGRESSRDTGEWENTTEAVWSRSKLPDSFSTCVLGKLKVYEISNSVLPQWPFLFGALLCSTRYLWPT